MSFPICSSNPDMFNNKNKTITFNLFDIIELAHNKNEIEKAPIITIKKEIENPFSSSSYIQPQPFLSSSSLPLLSSSSSSSSSSSPPPLSSPPSPPSQIQTFSEIDSKLAIKPSIKPTESENPPKAKRQRVQKPKEIPSF